MLSLHFFLAGMGCLIDLDAGVAGSSSAKGLSMDAARILRVEESGVNRERAWIKRTGTSLGTRRWRWRATAASDNVLLPAACSAKLS
jgi:hypothetical protein